MKRSHQQNIDAAQHEIDRRAAEGEDMTGARICPRTYAILPARKQVKLIARDGTLYLPFDDSFGNGTSILLLIYESGDCDRCVWPMRNKAARKRLARALFDAREISERKDFPFDAEIVLPNGQKFNFDEELAS